MAISIDNRDTRLNSIEIASITFIFLFLLMPTFVFQGAELVTIEQPRIVEYDLWIAHINIFDVLFLILTLILIKYTKPLSNQHVYYFSVIILTSLCLLLFGLVIQAVNGKAVTEFIDGLIYSFRIIIYFSFLYFLINDNNVNKIAYYIVLSCLALSCISILGVVFGGYEGIFGGRINFLGMGVNITADFLLLCSFLIHLFFYQQAKLKWFLVLSVFFVMVILTGSRRSLVLFFVIPVFLNFIRISNRDKIFFVVKVLIASVIFVSALYIFSKAFAEQLNLQGLIRIVETIENINDLQDGRSGMYNAALSVVQKYPFGVGLSDWAIQSKMSIFGTGSHTHNFLIQSYLKYGFAIVLFIFPLIILAKQISLNLLLLPIWVVFFLNQMTGYGFWNQKFCMFFMLLFVVTVKSKKMLDKS